MEYEELVKLLINCNQLVQEYGIVDEDTAAKCLMVTEKLKELVADGDYQKYRAWYIENIKPIS